MKRYLKLIGLDILIFPLWLIFKILVLLGHIAKNILLVLAVLTFVKWFALERGTDTYPYLSVGLLIVALLLDIIFELFRKLLQFLFKKKYEIKYDISYEKKAQNGRKEQKEEKQEQKTKEKGNSPTDFNFFSGADDVESVKKRYHKLMQIYHTDNGNTDKEMLYLLEEQYKNKIKDLQK